MDNKAELRDIILGKPQKSQERGIWTYLTEKVEVTRVGLWCTNISNLLFTIAIVLLLLER